MNKTWVLITVAFLAASPLAGCIENMQDLKDRIQGQSVETPPGNVTDVLDGVDGNVTGNASKTPVKPPVARMTVFGDNGALVYRASFVAENQTETPILTTPGKFTFVAADSETVNPGSELTGFTWTINGKTTEGRKAEAELTEPGIVMVSLKVTDSKRATDEQMIHLGILPQPFTETIEIQGGPLAGTDALPTGAASHPFTILAEKDGKPLQVTAISVVLDGSNPSDTKLTVIDPEGTETTADSNDATNPSETITYASGVAGEWTAVAGMFAGVVESYTITVTVTYLQIVEGLGDDGHGHAH